MMDMMDVGRHEQGPKQAGRARRQPDVKMIRIAGGDQQGFDEGDGPHRQAKQHGPNRIADQAGQDLERVVTKGERYIDMRIRMMDLVHAPEQRNAVAQPMHEIASPRSG
jgi:hypothetical protein